MFGSDFDRVFGIPAFPLQGADAQGGLFASNIQAPDANPGAGPAPMPGAPPPSAPAAASPAGPAALGAGPLAPATPQAPGQPAAMPDGGSMTPPPPAAGIGSPFGRPQL
jgi:hypothetical protein